MKKLNPFFKGKIRIIGGQWRSQKLSVINKPGLRPTTDSARETLFNWLSPFIINSNCLDCFSGSGALGIEALSRRAASATFLEIKHSVAKILRKNIYTLQASNATVINSDAIAYLAQPGKPKDIVFIDPPFQKRLIEKTLYLLEKYGWLSKNAFLYIESYKKNFFYIPSHWQLYRKKVSSHIVYLLYRF